MSVGDSLLRVDERDDRLVVAGEIDANTAPELASQLDPLPGEGDIRVDVSGVEFMDSSGLRVLIDAHQRAEHADRRLLVVRPSAAVSRVIEITGLHDHLHIVTS